MNIGLVTPYFVDRETINSGLANHFFTLAQGLSKQGHSVVVVHIRPQYPGEDNLYETQLLAPQLTVLTYKAVLPKWQKKLCNNRWALIDFLLKVNCMLIAAKNLGKIAKTHQLEVFETTSFFSLCYLYMFLNPKVPVVTRVSTTFLQIMDNYYPFKSRLYRLIGQIEIWAIRKSKHLITHAHAHALVIADLYRLNINHIQIIPHGIVKPSDIYPGPKNKPALKVLYVGRFEYRKGIDVLLTAIPIVLNKYPDVTFELIGEDKDNWHKKEFLKSAPEELSSRVIFMGAVNNPETNQAYANCDIFVAPSRYESFGLIYVEAMSYGKPVIGCRVGGVSEIITDHENGLFADPNNAESLADKIVLLCKNDALRTAMGINAKKTFEKKFTDDILATHSVDYYRKAISS
ncbi:glycosyltransferase family 4 protein [Mucilaginibacter rigui]|uniref:Glycosyltransferase family 4 protein n=1 Tax=Mucilaginibacter rigui TaxID=534635 RepID=A0ABR7X853_9SPHI|nr:glycosyltransferase family 4 protein [Mucilaginibacter rigui]MBD1386766.1 glycosyltransferase family 4 protein [Mucilaginibacter rigui]